MKKLLLTFVAMATSAMCFAQLQLATLEHEDSVSVYYGASALIDAHAAAVDGDIITLSPGMFTATDLTKLVTVRGAGMFNDTAAGVVRTTINGSFSIGLDTLLLSETHHLTLEGLYLDQIKCKKNNSPYLVKCFIRIMRYDHFSAGVWDAFNNGQVVNCIIGEWDIHGNPHGYLSTTNTLFVNSVIAKFVGSSSDRIGGNTFTNCVVGITRLWSVHQNNQFYGCILIGNDNQATHDNNTPTFYNAYSSDHCIGINATPPYYGLLPSDRNLHNYDSLASVFKYYRGTISDDNGLNFELQDSIATTILGNDGTQVGIYGGPMPFDPYVYNHKVSAARRTTPDGFLDLEIKLYDEE